MEDAMSLVVSGCRLAKELESDVLTANGAAGDLPEKCEEIARIFMAARDQIRALHGHVADALAACEPHSLPLGGFPVAVGPSLSKGKEVVIQKIPGASDGGGGSVKRRGVAEDSSVQLTRMRINGRKEGAKKRTVEVAAPVHGNTEIPPDDGFTWRKYGQKEILNAHFPRAYYRCTHQKLYGCPAKKLVQRLDNNPQVFQVTYRAHHTCHTSSTAPTAVPPPLPATSHHDMSPDTSLFRWLSMAATPSTSGAMVSSVIGDRRDEGEYHATVVDMADTMFNIINNGGRDNTLDFIFSESEPQDGEKLTS